METLGNWIVCAHAAQGPRRFSGASFSGTHRFSVLALQSVRSTSSPIILPFSSIDEKNRLLGEGISTTRFQRFASERSSLSRLDLELMLRRMVRAEEEKIEKDSGEEPDNKNDSGHQLWINRARNLQTTAQIFCSMMLWIMLFYITSVWDSEKPGKYRRRDRGRRK